MALNEKEKEESNFSFGVTIPSSPVEGEKLTSAIVEEKVKEIEEGVSEPKKRGRKAGSTNKPKETVVPEQVKLIFSPLVIGAHNGLCKLLKLSTLDKEQEKMVSETYAMLLHKRIPTIIEKHGDIIGALGATAFILGAKLTTETKIFDFTKPKDKENKEDATKQHHNDIGKEGERKDSFI